MSKLLVWLGNFNTEADFKKYMNQSAFYKWWKKYDEGNKNLRCQFCKELGIMNYDEDFLIMKYSPNGLEELLNVIPVDTDRIRAALIAHNMIAANVAIMYNYREGISLRQAANSTSVTFLGSFTFDFNPTGTSASTAGLKYMTWIGHTDKSESEFMEYFNQDLYLKELEEYKSGKSAKRPNPEHRCQFCKDVGIKFYYPEFLRIRIEKKQRLSSVQLLQSVIKDDKIVFIERVLIRENQNKETNNCAFCYIPNGFRNKNKDQKIFILTENMKGHIIPPKKYVEDLGNYNGLSYLATFMWE